MDSAAPGELSFVERSWPGFVEANSIIPVRVCGSKWAAIDYFVGRLTGCRGTLQGSPARTGEKTGETVCVSLQRDRKGRWLTQRDGSGRPPALCQALIQVADKRTDSVLPKSKTRA